MTFSKAEVLNIRPCRLQPNCHFFRLSDGGWRLHTPEGKFVRLRVTSAQGELLAQIFDGKLSLEIAQERDSSIEKLLELFQNQGFLTPLPEPTATLPLQTVLVLGENRLAEEVATLLQSSANIIRQADFSLPKDKPDLVIACADWLPDTAWQKLDAWCENHKISWLLAYREGRRWVVGPLYIPGETAGYHDTRARRLAATHYPEELAGYWSYLNENGANLILPTTTEAELAVVAGTIAGMMKLRLEGNSTVEVSDQLIYDPATLSWERHPVLPVPRDILRDLDE
jgi:hypothetical protein